MKRFGPVWLSIQDCLSQFTSNWPAILMPSYKRPSGANLGLQRCFATHSSHDFGIDVYTRAYGDDPMTTVIGKTFKSGNSQAVRLPREIAYEDGVELTITRFGDVVTMRPKRLSVKDMLALLEVLPGPGEVEVRDTEEIPERPGL